MKHVQTCLSDREDRASCFHHCGRPVRLLQTCICAGNPDKGVLTSEELLSSTCRAV